ncbi:LAFE_0E10814g1_1 [Lachancea fermentati]|uniref:U3 small nucleolar RNA-associated protein 25 n=1 Tax=Lachancea fermentati TaxID=4955 RepID=A0A1G4MDY8_LACFM|nr:LAFE_0E10814g1_1 [Lachancea fermentati]
MTDRKHPRSVAATYQGKRTVKNGRKEMRQIKMAHHGKKAMKEEEKGVSSSEDDEDEDGITEKDEVEDEDQKKKQVYSALLTLLNADRPAKKRKIASKKERVASGVQEDEGETKARGEEGEEETIENGLLEVQSEDDDEEEMEHGDDESEDEQDPFESHFNGISEADTDKLWEAFNNREIKYKSAKIPMGKEEDWIYSRPILPEQEAKSNPPALKESIHAYFIKKRLRINNDLLDPSQDPLTRLQKKLVDPMFQYNDILYEYSNYDQESEYRDLYVLHLLNHVYKTRDRILKNNQRLQDNNDQEFLDQGFTRPKVLVVVPTRNTAFEVISKLIEKSGLDQVDKKAKFNDQFFDSSLPPSSKPNSFQHVFKGNTNDFFVLGVKFTRKTIKLYSNFYQSDVIFCSPLGIQLILENTDKKKRQDDFLSSIELMIIDQLHSIEYQNLLHVSTIFDHINKIPLEQHDADFSRIRMWYINDQARMFRQTMIFTKYVSPFANSLINGRCRNYSGRWKNHHSLSAEESSIGQLGLRVRQIFQRFDLVGGSAIDEPDYRFKFFTSVMVPNIVKSTGYEDGILLYIPDYTDYVRVRNHLKEKTSVLFGDINEYSSQRQLTSNRALFKEGRVKVLLYTERLHHFRRYDISGVKTVLFYKPPNNPEFYDEVVRYIGKSAFLENADLNISVVRCIYSQLDGLALEKIVGTKRAAVLAHGQNEVYEFK